MKIRSFIIISFIMFFLNSCKNNDLGDKKNDDTKENIVDDIRLKQIENTKFFILNDFKSGVDENGITQEYRLEKINLNRVKKFDSNSFRCSESNIHKRICSYKSTFRYKLLINGELYEQNDFTGYEVEIMEVEYPQYNRSVFYSPELHNDEEKKSLVSYITIPSFGCGEDTNNKIGQLTIKSLYECGMLTK